MFASMLNSVAASVGLEGQPSASDSTGKENRDGDKGKDGDMRNSQNRPTSLRGSQSKVPGGGLGAAGKSSMKFDPSARANRTARRTGNAAPAAAVAESSGSSK